MDAWVSGRVGRQSDRRAGGLMGQDRSAGWWADGLTGRWMNVWASGLASGWVGDNIISKGIRYNI